jgi:hypothetical protein
VQRYRCHGNKLLIALVLFTVTLNAVWTPSQADARGLLSQPSSSLSTSKPGPIIASGDPDIGQGNTPSNPTVKLLHQLLSGGNWGTHAFSDWVRWAGRIWATLFQRGAP